MFRQVTIIGPGLLGGSLSLAVKKMAISEELVIWARSEKSLNKAVQTFPFARIEKDLQESVRGSDLIIICTPVEIIGDILKKIKPFIHKNSLVTDVGSIKGSICSIARKHSGILRLVLLVLTQWRGLKNPEWSFRTLCFL